MVPMRAQILGKGLPMNLKNWWHRSLCDRGRFAARTALPNLGSSSQSVIERSSKFSSSLTNLLGPSGRAGELLPKAPQAVIAEFGKGGQICAFKMSGNVVLYWHVHCDSASGSAAGRRPRPISSDARPHLPLVDHLRSRRLSLRFRYCCHLGCRTNHPIALAPGRWDARDCDGFGALWHGAGFLVWRLAD